jgi:uncharacterized protein YjbJ (UPF0337 family)
MLLGHAADFPRQLVSRSELMNWDRIEGNWKQFSGKVRQQWGKLTDDDLDVIDGRREELAGRIQEVYGVSKDEAEKQIDRFAGSLDTGTFDEVPGSRPTMERKKN